MACQVRRSFARFCCHLGGFIFYSLAFISFFFSFLILPTLQIRWLQSLTWPIPRCLEMVAEASTLRRSRQARLLIGLRPGTSGPVLFLSRPAGPDSTGLRCISTVALHINSCAAISTVAMGRFIYSRHFKVLCLFCWNKQLENSLFPPMSAERPPTSFQWVAAFSGL